MNSLENYVLNCEDCTKVVRDVEVQPSDLGPAKMHKYLIQKYNIFLLIIEIIAICN